MNILQAPAATQSSASESDEGEDGSKVINGGKKSGKERKTSTEIAEEVAKGMDTSHNFIILSLIFLNVLTM